MFRYNDNVKSMQHYGRDGNNRRCLVVCFIDFFISFFFFFRAETFTRVNRSRIQILDFNLVSQGELTLL